MVAADQVQAQVDATYTFDLAGPDGSVLSADELTRATATNLHAGGFAQVTGTAAVVAEVRSASPAAVGGHEPV